MLGRALSGGVLALIVAVLPPLWILSAGIFAGLGVIALVVAVLDGGYVRHRCHSCGHKWKTAASDK